MLSSSYPKARYELKPSRIALGQVGLFALAEFKKGSVIIEDSNWDETRLISWDEFEAIEPVTKNKLIDFCYKTTDGIHAPQDINRINIGYFMNHSCDPCVYCRENGDYIAVRDINVGDEFTLDVEALMEKTCHEFECNCGAVNCRKRIRI